LSYIPTRQNYSTDCRCGNVSHSKLLKPLKRPFLFAGLTQLC